MKPEDVKRYPAPWWIYLYGGLGSATIVLTGIAYACKIGGNLSPLAKDWAEFGDFFGGFLGPALAFFSFLALLNTIVLQTRELGLTREELTTTKDIANEQKENVILQRVENTFFQLLNTQYTIRDNITFASAKGLEAFSRVAVLFDRYKLRSHAMPNLHQNAKTSFEHLDKSFGRNDPRREEARDLYAQIRNDIVFLNTVHDKFRSYVQSLHYLLRFVDSQPPLNQNEATYIGILKAQLTHPEEVFLLRFALDPGVDLDLFPFYRILDRDPTAAKLKITEAQKFLAEIKEAFHPDLYAVLPP